MITEMKEKEREKTMMRSIVEREKGKVMMMRTVKTSIIDICSRPTMEDLISERLTCLFNPFYQ